MTVEALKALNRAIDDALYPYSQAIGTAPMSDLPSVLIPAAAPPSVQVQPAARPAPIQYHPRKKQSTGKNKDHPKETERPGRKQPPNYRPFRRPPPKPKPTPKPPKPKPEPKPEIGPDGNPVNPGSGNPGV